MRMEKEGIVGEEKRGKALKTNMANRKERKILGKGKEAQWEIGEIKDDDIAIDDIPLATKPPVIVEYKIIKEGIIGRYQFIRADGSSKRYSSMIRMLQDIDREDLKTLWKLVKTKHADTRLEDKHKRVLWGDLKVMFEPGIKSGVWRNLQGYTVTILMLYDLCGVPLLRVLIIMRCAINSSGYGKAAKMSLIKERGDDVAGIKRRHRDVSSDCIRNLATTSGHGRLKENLES
ncbi:hypothetical protein Tco_1295043, partial [Tanacetum coccineum]